MFVLVISSFSMPEFYSRRAGKQAKAVGLIGQSYFFDQERMGYNVCFSPMIVIARFACSGLAHYIVTS
jgi:hypothetical protein